MEPSTDLWAVVITISGEKYVGKLADYNINGSEEALQSITNGELITLGGALNFSDTKIPIPNPHNPGQIAINRTVNVAPFAFSMDPEHMVIHVRVSDISFFHEMSALDKAAHEQAVHDGYDMVMRARAQRSGIVTPSQSPLTGRTH